MHVPGGSRWVPTDLAPQVVHVQDLFGVRCHYAGAAEPVSKANGTCPPEAVRNSTSTTSPHGRLVDSHGSFDIVNQAPMGTGGWVPQPPPVPSNLCVSHDSVVGTPGFPGAIEVVPNLIGELRHRRDLLLAPRARAARENVVLLMAGYGGDDAPQSPLQRTNMDLQKKHLVLLRKKLFKKKRVYTSCWTCIQVFF